VAHVAQSIVIRTPTYVIDLIGGK